MACFAVPFGLRSTGHYFNRAHVQRSTLLSLLVEIRGSRQSASAALFRERYKSHSCLRRGSFRPRRRTEPDVIRFFYSIAPNPMKVALFLEEAHLEYEAIPIDTKLGDQHTPTVRAINPNGKVPALIDGDAVLCDSNAILLYLAEKDRQIPTQAGRRVGCARRVAVLADVCGDGRRPLFRAMRAFPPVRAGAASLPDQAL